MVRHVKKQVVQQRGHSRAGGKSPYGGDMRQFRSYFCPTEATHSVRANERALFETSTSWFPFPPPAGEQSLVHVLRRDANYFDSRKRTFFPAVGNLWSADFTSGELRSVYSIVTPPYFELTARACIFLAGALPMMCLLRGNEARTAPQQHSPGYI